MNIKKTFLPAIILSVICLLSASALALTHEATKARIAKAERERYFAAAAAVMPEGVVLTELDSDEVDGFVGTDVNGKHLGYVIRAAKKGYGGKVICVVGFDMTGKIIGLSVSAPDETPGLGSNVQLPSFTDQFIGAVTPPALKDEIDGVTSATYSSRAVTEAVAEAFAQLARLKGGA